MRGVEDYNFILDSDVIADELPDIQNDDAALFDVVNATKEEASMGWPPYRRRSLLKKKKSDSKCNNDSLRKILRENMDNNPTTAKRLIYHAALETLNFHVNVICSERSFSFLIRTTAYCQEYSNGMTCFAYKEN
uniref:Ground-like domain-containing protein n=1 Tax=Panagrolaimus sp. ES5 TaxID=591445 RepID=A0AC34GNE2_9BILA